MRGNTFRRRVYREGAGAGRGPVGAGASNCLDHAQAVSQHVQVLPTLIFSLSVNVNFVRNVALAGIDFARHEFCLTRACPFFRAGCLLLGPKQLREAHV